jgi:hypothetical protein
LLPVSLESEEDSNLEYNDDEYVMDKYGFPVKKSALKNTTKKEVLIKSMNYQQSN